MSLHAEFSRNYQTDEQSFHLLQVERLLNIAPEIQPYLRCIAFPKDDNTQLYQRFTSSDQEYGSGLLATLADEDIVENLKEHKRDQLLRVFRPLVDTIARNNACLNGDSIQWQTVTFDLLSQSIVPANLRTDTTSQPDLLQAAFAASLLSDNSEVRRDFLRAVYGLGQQRILEKTLRSDVSIVLPRANSDTDNRRFNYYANTFTVTPEAMEYYLDYTDPGRLPLDNPQAKLYQRKLVDAYQSSSATSELQEAAEIRGRANEAQQSAYIDPYKVERFALQQLYIRDQMQQLFSSDMLADSPFVRELTAKYRGVRGDPYEAMNDLLDQVEAVFKENSLVVNADYNLLEDDDAQQGTARQQVAARYKYLISQTAQFGQIGCYIDYAGATNDIHAQHEHISELSQEGAAAPIAAGLLIQYVVHQALIYREDSGETIASEVLYQLCLGKRKQLMKFAVLNLSDFAMIEQVVDRFPSYEDIFNPNVHLKSTFSRTADGVLNLQVPFLNATSKLHNDTHEGVTLGCPAIRLGFETLRHSVERGTDATNNFVDYTIEAVLNEAYRRGIFDLNRLQKPNDYPQEA